MALAAWSKGDLGVRRGARYSSLVGRAIRFRVGLAAGLLVAAVLAFSIFERGEVAVEPPVVDEGAQFAGDVGATFEVTADPEAHAAQHAPTRAERETRARREPTRREAERPHARGISGENPLGDLVPPL